MADTLFNPSEGVTIPGSRSLRCLNCGNLEDALIRMARCIPEHPSQHEAGPQRRV